MVAEGKTIIFYRCNFFHIFISSLLYFTWDLNQTWPVGRKWCRFTNAPKTFWGLPPKLERKNITFWTIFFATSALDIAYLQKETSHRQPKMLVSIYNVSPTSWPTFRNLWPRNGWDPFVYCVFCDPPFGGHYVATIKVATSLVHFVILKFQKAQHQFNIARHVRWHYRFRVHGVGAQSLFFRW